jgi:hypothetical protein
MAAHQGKKPEDVIDFASKGATDWWNTRTPVERAKSINDHESIRQAVEQSYRDREMYEASLSETAADAESIGSGIEEDNQ